MPYFLITAAGEIYLHATTQHCESLKDLLFSYLGYSSNDYSWYIVMFAGLYMIIPFLNTMYKSLKSRENLLLLIILTFFTVMPSVQESFLLPKIIPDFWRNLYPITYYFTGAYIREFKSSLSATAFFPIISAAILMPVLIQTMSGSYTWYVMNGFNSVSAFVISITVFSFLHIKKRPKLAAFRRLSAISLYIYLIPFYVDRYVWADLPQRPSLHAIFLQSIIIYAASAVISSFFHKITSRII